MSKKYIVFFLFFFLGYLHSQNIIAPKNFKIFDFKINNSDSSTFGYEEFEMDQDVGPKSICIIESYAYISDVFHNQIKKIDLNTGGISSSKNLDKSFDYFIWLNGLVPFNGKLIALTDIYKVYSLNTDLSIHKEFKVETSPFKEFISISSGKLTIAYNFSSKDGHATKYKTFQIDKEWNLTFETKTNLDILKQNFVNGKSYKLFENNSIIEFSEKRVSLKEPIPHIDYYDTINIDFTNEFLVYYNVNPKELQLYVYKL